MHNHNYQTKEI